MKYTPHTTITLAEAQRRERELNEARRLLEKWYEEQATRSIHK